MNIKRENIKFVAYLSKLSMIIFYLNTDDVKDITFKFSDRLKAQKQLDNFIDTYNLVLNKNSKNCYIVENERDDN